MLIPKAISAKLNDQIAMEFSAAHKYLAMACALDAMGLKVLAKRFLSQHDEESKHALKIVSYLLDVGAPVELVEIPEPENKYKDAKAIVEAALESEMAVTKSINDLVSLAEKEKDYATRSFLNWYVDEQVEEVSSMIDLLNLIELAKGNMLQVEARVFHQIGAGK